MGIYDRLNSPQKEAVFQTEGPLLILAGAGSGKTRVLTHRIAFLIAEQGINPWNILAITFTNKAADEMRERVNKLVGAGAEKIWVSTFHSCCVRILRRHIDVMGRRSNFVIYDSDDQKSLIKEIMRRQKIDPKVYKERMFLSRISRAKDDLIYPDQMEKEAHGNKEDLLTAGVYREYQAELEKNNAMDFDDLLVKTVELFEQYPEVLAYYQDRFRYIHIDEYQDTNHAQFRFVSLLAAKYRNLCVVGDDDQSIYKFRGANLHNILGFEDEYPEAVVIRLEQNYRSTGSILRVANEVIKNNTERKPKTLWTEQPDGPKVHYRQLYTGYEEAEYVVGEIEAKVRQKEAQYRDCAVLYRTNAQSRLFEEKLLNAGIPYKIVGGINFYARREIKDILCYLRTIDNGHDDLSVSRIVNVPRRGIGAASLGRLQDFALEKGISLYEAMEQVRMVPGLSRGAAKIEGFVTFIRMLRTKAENMDVRELIEAVLEDTGYKAELTAEGTEESKARLENLDELLSTAASYLENCKERGEASSLAGFLEEVALVADVDRVIDSEDYVLLMTLHSAKGLEFPYVFMAGMDDGIFPGYAAISYGDRSDIEEERRLCYVGITRAMKELTLVSARQRMTRGEIQNYKPSRFVQEIPRELVDLGYESPLQSRRLQQMKDMAAGGSALAQLMGAGSVHGENAGADKEYGGSGKGSLADASAYAAKTPLRPAYGSLATGAPAARPSLSPEKPVHLDYAVGDRVRHIKFGTGMVKDIRDGGRDYEVTVEFEKFGVKKMFAGFAKLQKC